MADAELATRAPESDAQEVPPAVKESPFPGDSIAQEGPSMGVRSLAFELIVWSVNYTRNTALQTGQHVGHFRISCKQ